MTPKPNRINTYANRCRLLRLQFRRLLRELLKSLRLGWLIDGKDADG